MQKRVPMYPPNGGEPVVPHPAKVEEMKEKGWTESPPENNTTDEGGSK